MSPYNEDGVDLTLIDWMLSLTPAERLDVMQGAIQEMEEIRKYRAYAPDSRHPEDPEPARG